MSETKSPLCVGIIMDGNRRWAKAHGLPKIEGHRVGAEKLKDMVRLARSCGVRHLAVYAFSTENWHRESEEVSYLMDLFQHLLQREMRKLGSEGVRVRFAGQCERFSANLQEAMRECEEETAHNDAITLWVCLSYGGRAEMVSAARSAGEEGEITEDSLAHHLWTKDMPDPDIIIRTGGEKRLSGFLTWQSVYSELFFSDTLWPDFSPEEFTKILEDFTTRERRHGK